MKPFTKSDLQELERLIPTNVWAITVEAETYRRLIAAARLVAVPDEQVESEQRPEGIFS